MSEQAEPLIVYALSYCARYQFDKLREKLLTSQRCMVFHGVLHIEWQQGDIFVFNYGVIVFWGLNTVQRNAFIELTIDDVIDEYNVKMSDEFSYETRADTLSIKNDHLTLADDDVMSRLALSHGIAQSTKLAQFEWQTQQTINETSEIPRKIATTGTTRLSRRELSKLRGRLFIAKSNITLNYDLLDIPDFFWEYPELDPFYKRVADYLEISQRVEVLSKKLETIHELLAMMADEQKHKHSSLLEWIIIWLIAVEIIFFLFHDIFKIF